MVSLSQIRTALQTGLPIVMLAGLATASLVLFATAALTPSTGMTGFLPLEAPEFWFFALPLLLFATLMTLCPYLTWTRRSTVSVWLVFLPLPLLLLGLALALMSWSWSFAVPYFFLFAAFEAFGGLCYSRHHGNFAATSFRKNICDDEETGEIDVETAEYPDSLGNPDLVQHLTRLRCEDGTDRIDALLRADFLRNRSLLSLHLPFQPPMENPQVEVVPLDTLPVSVQVAKLLPQGLRLDLKRDRARKEPESLRIHVTVTDNPPNRCSANSPSDEALR